jgi:hypothetical protein
MRISRPPSNLRIMEVDVDRLAWDDEVFTSVPQFEDGHLVVPDTLGWAPNQTKKRSAPTRRNRAAVCCITGSRDGRIPIALDQRSASFETAASRPPQDEEFS